MTEEAVDVQKRIVNINTLASQCKNDFLEMADAAKKISQHIDPKFREGFDLGVNALRDQFLDALDRDDDFQYVIKKK